MLKIGFIDPRKNKYIQRLVKAILKEIIVLCTLDILA